MRVLHLDSGKAWHGGQIQMRMLVEGLRREGVECGVRSPLLFEPMAAPDLIHCHDARTHTWATRPFVVSRRVGFPVGRGWLSRWKYSRAAAYLAVSRYTAGTLASAGVPVEKIHVVSDAIRPMPLANRSTGRVLLLSKNGQTFAGAVPVCRIENDLKECDVLVYLSDMEGLGSAALLAQAAGVPVVASRAGGLPEAIKYGIVVDDIRDVPEAIEKARAVRVDVKAVMTEFGVERLVANTMAVYRKVLES